MKGKGMYVIIYTYKGGAVDVRGPYNMEANAHARLVRDGYTRVGWNWMHESMAIQARVEMLFRP